MQYYCIYRDLATYRIISDFQICQIKQMIYYIICVAAALRSLFSSLDNLRDYGNFCTLLDYSANTQIFCGMFSV